MILLIDNYDSFTWNLVHRLGELEPTLELHRDLRVFRNDAVTAASIERINAGTPPDAIIISPGPCTPAESGCSLDVIRAFAGRIPILGVCLGHQAIAAVHGLSVQPHILPVHGKAAIIHHDNTGLFNGLPNPFPAARYHSLHVLADSIPAVDHLGLWEISAWTDEPADAQGPARRVVMGLRRRWSDPSLAPLEGVQFHPESFLTPDGPALLRNFLTLARLTPAKAPSPPR